MEEQRQNIIPANRMAGPLGPRPPMTAAGPAAALTPKDIAAIFRRHILLIISMTILGVIMGGAAWFLLLTFAPKYRTETFIKVLPPIEKDPMVLGGGQVNKDILYGHRQSIAALIRQQTSLESLLNSDKIQETKWFQGFGDIKADRFRKAFKKLKKRLGAHAHRDAEFVSVSMVCGDAEESALRVNEMVSLFLASRRTSTSGEVRAKMTKLTDQQLRLESELRLAERGLDDIASDTGFTDLKDRGDFRDTVTMKLQNLDIEQNKLQLDIKQIQAVVGNLERQATEPVGTQVEHQIEN
ncbi:hypothetical protein KA005_76870, partial [bacterium]|nr:hypothetical protein [bacterium]